MKYWISSLLALFVLFQAVAQTQGETPLRVSLLTCAPGREVYQLEGHAALRLTRAGVYDLVVNWGIFDFNSPNFLYRFVKGETDYMALAYPYELFLREYRQEGRGVVEDVLRLSPDEAARLEALVQDNLLPEHRTYRYNYVADNCATRPLALIEQALGDTLRFTPPAAFTYGETEVTYPESLSPQDYTFRREMTRYHDDYPWYQFGIDLALGAGIDRPITQRERVFSPVFLHEFLKTAVRPDGEPLLAATLTALPASRERVTDAPTPWPLRPVAVCAVVFALVAWSAWRDIRRGKITRWVDTVLYGAFFLAGCLLTFLIFVSVHEAVSPNWLYLWLNPLCLVPVVGEWLKSCKGVVYCYQICNFALLILLLAGHHFFGQALNAAFPLLILADMARSFAYIWVHRASTPSKPRSEQPV